MPQSPLIAGQFSTRRLFAIVAAWAIAFAWPYWAGLRYTPSWPSWANIITLAVCALSVGLPLTFLIIGGRRIIPWLVAGSLLAYLIAAWYLYSEFRRRSGIEYVTLAVFLGGLGASVAGNIRACYRRCLAHHWLPAIAWALAALACSAIFAWFVWLLRVL